MLVDKEESRRRTVGKFCLPPLLLIDADEDYGNEIDFTTCQVRRDG